LVKAIVLSNENPCRPLSNKPRQRSVSNLFNDDNDVHFTATTNTCSTCRNWRMKWN